MSCHGGVGPYSGARDPQALTTIASACRDRERLRFAYGARDGAATRRLVEPHSLVNLGRRWYLLAWDCGREGWRTFRLDRLERPAGAGGRNAERELPGGGDAASYVATNLSHARQRYEARVTLLCPAERIRERPYLWGSVEPIDEASCEYRTADDNLDWLAMRIAMLGVDFIAAEPPELVERLGAVGARIDRALAVSAA